MLNRNVEIRKAADLLERDMEFLGVSGVEDKLQDDVAVTIENMRNAGIKVWMLTGDKVATAKCIAVMSGIKPGNCGFFEIVGPISELEMRHKLNDFGN